MTARNFLKPKNFKIKAKSLSFKSVQYMTDLEKKKIYINFVKLLNNHFKRTLFKKDLYQHFTNHCGFIAHYNIHGFYGEYFKTAAKFHFNVNNYSNPISEYAGNLNQSSSLSHGEQFYAIYGEINGTREGLGLFYDTLGANMNYGAYGDYTDLDNAIKDAFSEYMEIWREEIRKAVKAYDKFSKDEKRQELKDEQKRLNKSTNSIQKASDDEPITVQSTKVIKIVPGTQMNLFDFMKVA